MTWPNQHKLQNGKLIIETTLGQGGFGITYKAWHAGLNAYVVIKTPNEFLKHDPEYHKYVKRFQNEAQILGKLFSEPNLHIVRFYDFFTEADNYCLVMEYVEGESLDQLIKRRGKLPEAGAVRYFQQIGNALTVVHKMGLVHRDAHPGNIMLHRNNDAVLIDFGISGEIVPKSISTPLGNKQFAPYEQIRKGNRAPTVDIYALSGSLYYAVTGKLPANCFDRKLDEAELIPPQEIVAVSSAVNNAIMQGMEMKPENRPQSMQEWLDLLGDDLSSQVGVDYTRLRDLLAAGEWKEADEETAKVMLKASNQEERGWLEVEDIDNFPCTDLRTIDQLWIKYSKERFGFSVQKQIYQSLGGIRKYDREIWQAFDCRVGWRKEGDLLYYPDLTMNVTAPQGHLPVAGWIVGWGLGGELRDWKGLGAWVSLLSRRDL
ncbi:MAG: serine/threonine-protein kinase [Oscillatoria sp. PMC 1068.18]|nr:serine/threonine-protein kinase [Oscillatoria sp. PMC 1076.18]MEC4987439.1 serine/threonine-protein kinase [Oscillatoria sp. PMC 1068.18]